MEPCAIGSRDHRDQDVRNRQLQHCEESAGLAGEARHRARVRRFQKNPPTREQVARWCKVLGVDAVVNTRGTTWRTLDATEQARTQTESGAIAVLLAHPSAIKRPVIEHGSGLLIGFDETRYAGVLQT